MKESLGPRKKRKWGECHVFAKTVWRRCGESAPQRTLLRPEASLKLRSQDSGTGPKHAQWTSDAVLRRVRSEVGRLRLEDGEPKLETDEVRTHCFSPWKLFEIKLSFLPNERKEPLLDVAAMLGCYWLDGDMTSPATE